jgi:chitinase
MQQARLLLALSVMWCVACSDDEKYCDTPNGCGPATTAGSAGVGAGGGVGGSVTTTGGSAGSASGAAGASVVGGAGGASGGSGGGGGSPPVTTHPELRTVVYLPDYRGALSAWVAPKMDFSRMSYVNLSFAVVDAQANVSYKYDGEIDAFVANAHANGVKVCMAIGGAGTIPDGGVFATVLQDGMRSTLVSNLTKYATDHQLDCIDVDLEGNGVNQYYEAFVTSLATSLHGVGKEMTAAVGSWFGDKITVTALQAFDFVNVMAYDLHNPYGSAQPIQSASLDDAKVEVDYWVNKGLAKNKAVFGVPFYGFAWVEGKPVAKLYSEILAVVPEAATMDQVQLAGATTYLNSRATIVAKTKLAYQYGGIMVWEVGQDAAGDASLLKAMAETKP